MSGRPDPDDRAGHHDWENLRRPFEDLEINILCQPTRKNNAPGQCGDCGKWHKLPSIPLSYVGHADITARLNEAEWSWRPLGVEPTGVPAIVVGQDDLFLWIELTVWDRSVIEVGAVAKGKPEAMKLLVSDALRRAAMRFGIALDLWKKEKWEPDQDDAGTGAAQASPPPPPAAPPPGGPSGAAGHAPPPPQGTPAAVQSIILRAEEEESVTGERYRDEIVRCISRITGGDKKWMEWVTRQLTAWEKAPQGYPSFKPFNDRSGNVQTNVVFRKWEALAGIDELLPSGKTIGAEARKWVKTQATNASLKAHKGTASGSGEEDYEEMTESMGGPPMGGPPDYGAPPPEDDDIPF